MNITDIAMQRITEQNARYNRVLTAFCRPKTLAEAATKLKLKPSQLIKVVSDLEKLGFLVVDSLTKDAKRRDVKILRAVRFDYSQEHPPKHVSPRVVIDPAKPYLRTVYGSGATWTREKKKSPKTYIGSTMGML